MLFRSFFAFLYTRFVPVYSNDFAIFQENINVWTNLKIFFWEIWPFSDNFPSTILYLFFVFNKSHRKGKYHILTMFFFRLCFLGKFRNVNKKKFRWLFIVSFRFEFFHLFSKSDFKPIKLPSIHTVLKDISIMVLVCKYTSTTLVSAQTLFLWCWCDTRVIHSFWSSVACHLSVRIRTSVINL